MTQPTDILTEEQQGRFSEAWYYIAKYNLWSEYFDWFKQEHPDISVTESLIVQTIIEFVDTKEYKEEK